MPESSNLIYGVNAVVEALRAGTRQIDANFTNVAGAPAVLSKNQLNIAHSLGLYVEDQFDVTPSVTLVIGGRGSYAIREVRDRWAFYRDRRPDAYDPIVAR